MARVKVVHIQRYHRSRTHCGREFFIWDEAPWTPLLTEIPDLVTCQMCQDMMWRRPNDYLRGTSPTVRFFRHRNNYYRVTEDRPTVKVDHTGTW